MAGRRVANTPAALTKAQLSLVAQGLERQVYVLRGVRVMLAADLAPLYEVETRVLMQAVRRNIARFPEDFAFVLKNQDVAALKSQIVISNDGGKEQSPSRGGSRATPMAFTEQGIAMLSSVLNSDRAVAVNIEIIRTFVKLRSIVSEHQTLKHKLEALETKYDDTFSVVFDAIHQLMDEPKPGGYGGRKIGFTKEK